MNLNSGRAEPGSDCLDGVASLLARWQADHDADDFVALVHAPLARMAARTLRERGIRDPGACDDVVAMVIERLFRLSAPAGAKPLRAFACCRVDRDAAVDPGWALVRCIVRSRAHDLARSTRRRDRLAAGYAAAARDATPDEFGVEPTDIVMLRRAIASLDGRSRKVVELLLDGKSQAVVAHVLGVCEGTVSRIRTKAIARLRALLAANKRGGVVSRRPRSARRG